MPSNKTIAVHQQLRSLGILGGLRASSGAGQRARLVDRDRRLKHIPRIADSVSSRAEIPDCSGPLFELVDRPPVARPSATHDAAWRALVVAHGIQQLLTFNTAGLPAEFGAS